MQMHISLAARDGGAATPKKEDLGHPPRYKVLQKNRDGFHGHFAVFLLGGVGSFFSIFLSLLLDPFFVASRVVLCLFFCHCWKMKSIGLFSRTKNATKFLCLKNDPIRLEFIQSFLPLDHGRIEEGEEGVAKWILLFPPPSPPPHSTYLGS